MISKGEIRMLRGVVKILNESRLAFEEIHDEADHALYTQSDNPKKVMQANLRTIRSIARRMAMQLREAR